MIYVLYIMALLISLLFLPLILLQVTTGITCLLLGKIIRYQNLADFGYFLALSADQNANVFFLGFPDESISGRIGRAVYVEKKPKAFTKALRWFVDGIFRIFGEKDHCKNAIEYNEYFKNDLWAWYHREKK